METPATSLNGVESSPSKTVQEEKVHPVVERISLPEEKGENEEPEDKEDSKKDVGKQQNEIDEIELEFPKVDVVEAVKVAIQQYDNVDNVNAVFSACKTDIERFRVLYSNPVIYDAVEIKEDYISKDLEMAKKLRTDGNEKFKAKQNTAALQLYSKSIIMAPLPKDNNSPELSLAFANRSAVLYHLEKYILCLQDIKMALKYQYPEKLKYKLYERKGKCYYYLKQKEEAITAFEDSMEHLENSGLDENKSEAIENDIIKQVMKARKIKNTVPLTKKVQDFNHCHGTVPKICNPSPEIPCTSDSLVLKYSPDRGRGIYTTKDVEVGELLIFEKPYASVVLESYDLTHCCNCSNRVFAPIPCEYCSGIIFCSEECQIEGWKLYHFAECKVLQTMHNTELGLGHLALRMVLKAGLQNILQNSKKYPEKIKSDVLRMGFNKDGIYSSDDYDAVYTLVKHSEKRTLGDLFKRTVMAIFLVKCLEKSLTAQPLASKSHLPEKCIIGSHILRHIQMLPCNAHEVSELDYRQFDLPNSQTVEIGPAIYATLSLINHSCDPNVVRHSYGNNCAVRAIRNIPKGTEIFDNYGALSPLCSKKDRQEKLMYQYYFKCSCKACIENWPLYFNIPSEVPFFYCEKCSGPLVVPEDGKTQRTMCEKCRYVQDMTPKIDVFMRSDEIFTKKLKEIVKGEVTSDALDVLTNHLRTLDRLIVRPFADYNDCQEAIKQCLNLQANCKKRDIYN
ncbi:hypothetical protein SNE40_003204 [Patella caerulea]|uniref:Protein-lysine N-methyltransferase SMYD4 n=2 Tax=Patella caerulea TaxID=87958 RepID=A0AAN8Q4U3_PATCE